MEIEEVITAYGHRNIQATHRTTFEVTKEKELSKRGDCIIAVSADKALADLSPEFKKHLRMEKNQLTISVKAGNTIEFVNASGSPKLILTHPSDIVVRKSDYTCSRTLGVHADKAACDFSKELVQKLKNPKQKVTILLSVEV